MQLCHLTIRLEWGYNVGDISAPESSHCDCNDSLVDSNATIDEFFAFLFFPLLDQFLSLLSVAFPISLPLIHSVLFVNQMPAVKHTNHADLVVLEQIDELVDVEEEGE